MAWIESHQELGRHPKTKRLARALGVSVAAAIGHLHLLWWWALDFAQDGVLDGYEAGEIADAALWEGEADAFFGAMLDTGFIDGNDAGQFVLHDWDDYAGKLIDRRQKNAEKQRAWRDRHKPSSIEEPNRDVTVTSTLRDGATVPNSTVPNHTEPEDTHLAVSDAAAPSPPATLTTPWSMVQAMIDVLKEQGKAPDDWKPGAGWRKTQCALAEQLVADGRDPPDVTGCLRWLLTTEHWSDKALDMRPIKSQMDTWISNGRPKTAAKKERTNGTAAINGRADEAAPDHGRFSGAVRPLRTAATAGGLAAEHGGKADVPAHRRGG